VTRRRRAPTPPAPAQLAAQIEELRARVGEFDRTMAELRTVEDTDHVPLVDRRGIEAALISELTAKLVATMTKLNRYGGVWSSRFSVPVEAKPTDTEALAR
jgi:hypothetical protein